MSSSIDVTFVRTWQLLAINRLRTNVRVILALIVLFGGWFVWLVVGRISIYATSQQARLEAASFPQPIQAPVDGVVLDCSLSLGRHVQSGEVLVQLDARNYELQLAEVQAALNGETAAIASIKKEIAAQEEARLAAVDLQGKSERTGRARVNASRTSQTYAEKETAVLRTLSEKDLASGLDKLRAEEQSEGQRAGVAVVSAQAAEQTSSQRAVVLDRDAQIAGLQKSLTDAESQIEVLQARIATFRHEIDLRHIRANSAGILIDIVPCTHGMTVSAQGRLATLLPDSALRIVGLYKPEDAVGRIKAGQEAIVRVDNFPWTQFGTVTAVVDNVGSEPRDGLVRVELHVSKPNPAIPIAHGLSGIAEVRVETISPLNLLLRTVGEHITPHHAPAPAQLEAAGRGA